MTSTNSSLAVVISGSEFPNMSQSALDRQCPQCKAGVGLPRAVSTIPGRQWVMNVKMVCETCHHEWTVEKRDPMEILVKTES